MHAFAISGGETSAFDRVTGSRGRNVAVNCTTDGRICVNMFRYVANGTVYPPLGEY